MKFKFIDEKEGLIREKALRDIKLVTGYKFLKKYASHISYKKRINILADEFHLSEQGIKNIIQKLTHE